jgi:hypothetical protein
MGVERSNSMKGGVGKVTALVDLGQVTLSVGHLKKRTDLFHQLANS